MSSILSEPHFHSEEAAFAFVEAWIWPNGPECPFCGCTKEHIGSLQGVRSKPSKKNPEGKVTIGLRKCYGCRKQFTVRVGTIFEASHAPLRIWLQAIYLLCSSKKGISSRQLQRTLRVGMKTAWFLGHRIREAMAPASDAGMIGGEGVIVESDETELGGSHKTRKTKPRSMNKKFVALVERGGRVRSRDITGARVSITQEVREALQANLHPASTLHTDSAVWYDKRVPAAKHEMVNHSKEYARTAEDGSRVYTNSAEGYFSIFKRGLVGTYQHMSSQHLQRYLNEFDFRMNTRTRLGYSDETRTHEALKGAKGKRLTYQKSRGQA